MSGWRPRPAGELASLPSFSPLFRRWLAGNDPRLGSAAADRQRFLAPGNGEGPAPFWADTGTRATWWRQAAADYPDPAAREAAATAVRLLAGGKADVVVTGQQPGTLGGPLYTLFKVAAAVAWAAARTAAGRPTVPLFWLADDDDDWPEALAPRLPDPRRGVILAVYPRPRPQGLLGRADSARVAAGAAAWLATVASRHPLAGRLATLWREAVAEHQPWWRLQRRLWLTLFGRSGLLVLRGDDPLLAGIGTAWLAPWAGRQERLAELVRERGAVLQAAGYHAQLAEAALARPWHVVTPAGERHAAAAPPAADLAAGRVRPGVLFRSLLQDALLRPAGVVVGPGEAAYLQQLAPLYPALDVPRPPRLPRLFATVGAPPAPPGDGATAVPEEALQRTVQRAVAGLDRLLTGAGLPAAEARRRAVAAGARWETICRRHVTAALRERAEARRPRNRLWQPPDPAVRQERWLAAGWALAWWGEPLLAGIAAAADRHVGGEWTDWALTGPEEEP